MASSRPNLGKPLVKWYGYNFKLMIAEGNRKALNKVGSLVVKEVKRLIRTPARKGHQTASKTGKSRMKYTGKMGSEPSQPGEPPRKRTGLLLRSIHKQMIRKGRAVQIVASDPKAHLLELGTKKMEARPFLRAALESLKSQIAEILTAPIQGKGGAK